MNIKARRERSKSFNARFPLISVGSVYTCMARVAACHVRVFYRDSTHRVIM